MVRLILTVITIVIIFFELNLKVASTLYGIIYLHDNRPRKKKRTNTFLSIFGQSNNNVCGEILLISCLCVYILAGDAEVLSYFYGPIGILLMMNLTLFAATARELTCGLWRTEVVKSTSERYEHLSYCIQFKTLILPDCPTFSMCIIYNYDLLPIIYVWRHDGG